MAILVGDTLTSVRGIAWNELWAHDTSNHSTWQVADIRSGGHSSQPGNFMSILVGDTLYFSANDGSSGNELWAHDTSNHSTWQVADINSGSGNSASIFMAILVGDTLYFSASDGSSGNELWAHGYYGGSPIATGQTACETGTYQPLAGQDECVDASVGYYSPGTSYSATAGYYNATSQVPCEAGTYSSQDSTLDSGLSGASACTQAQSGYYSPGTTGGTNVDSTVTTIASNELPCPAGTYSSFSASNSSADRASCFDAPAGSYSEGTYTLNGQTIVAISATQCSAGTWQDQTGQTSCKWSDFGYYVGSTGQTEQTPCEAGTYTSSSPRSSCTPASSGYYSPGTVGGQNVDSSVNTAAVNQIMCHAGYYSSYTTQTPNTDRVECTEVEAGYYSPGTYTMNGTHFNATQQIPCANGTWQDQTGQASCMDASVGYYVELTTQTSQQPCEAGEYQPATGQSSCIEAAAGYYHQELSTEQTLIECNNSRSSTNTMSSRNLPSTQCPVSYNTNQETILGTYTVNGATQLATRNRL